MCTATESDSVARAVSDCACLQTSAEVGARDAIITQLREVSEGAVMFFEAQIRNRLSTRVYVNAVQGLTMAQEETETLRNSDKDLRQQLEASARAYKSRNEQLVQENQILLQVRIQFIFHRQ